MKKISVYGIGNFGFAILNHLGNKKNSDYKLHAYDRSAEVRKCLKKNKNHPFFHKTVKINSSIVVEDTVDGLVKDCDILILAVASGATKEVAKRIKNKIKKPLIIVNTAKALDAESGKRLSEIIQSIIPGEKIIYAALAGGTIAKDLLKENPLGVDVACEDEKARKEVISIFSSRNLTAYPTADLIGLEYASALKNVISILAGIINGMGFSYGSETHVVSKAAQEIENLVVNKFGANRETFSMHSQCWGNDLWMSCTGNTRNREFGIYLGKGLSVDSVTKIMEELKKTVEGTNTIKVLSMVPSLIDYKLLHFLYDFIILKKATLEDLKNIIYYEKY